MGPKPRSGLSDVRRIENLVRNSSKRIPRVYTAEHVNAIVSTAIAPVGKRIEEHVREIEYTRKLADGQLKEDIRREVRKPLSDAERKKMFNDSLAAFSRYLNIHGIDHPKMLPKTPEEIRGIADSALVELYLRHAKNLLK